MHGNILQSALLSFISYHHSFIALLARHEFRDHSTVLLINSGLVVVNSAAILHTVVIRHAASMLARLNLWQLNCIDTSDTSLLFIRTDCALDTMRRKHGMVQMESALRCLTLSFVLIIVHAINIDNALIALT